MSSRTPAGGIATCVRGWNLCYYRHSVRRPPPFSTYKRVHTLFKVLRHTSSTCSMYVHKHNYRYTGSLRTLKTLPKRRISEPLFSKNMPLRGRTHTNKKGWRLWKISIVEVFRCDASLGGYTTLFLPVGER